MLFYLFFFENAQNQLMKKNALYGTCTILGQKGYFPDKIVRRIRNIDAACGINGINLQIIIKCQAWITIYHCGCSETSLSNQPDRLEVG